MAGCYFPYFPESSHISNGLHGIQQTSDMFSITVWRKCYSFSCFHRLFQHYQTVFFGELGWQVFDLIPYGCLLYMSLHPYECVEFSFQGWKEAQANLFRRSNYFVSRKTWKEEIGLRLFTNFQWNLLSSCNFPTSEVESFLVLIFCAWVILVSETNLNITNPIYLSFSVLISFRMWDSLPVRISLVSFHSWNRCNW